MISINNILGYYLWILSMDFIHGYYTWILPCISQKYFMLTILWARRSNIQPKAAWCAPVEVSSRNWPDASRLKPGRAKSTKIYKSGYSSHAKRVFYMRRAGSGSGRSFLNSSQTSWTWSNISPKVTKVGLWPGVHRMEEKSSRVFLILTVSWSAKCLA